MFDSVKRSLKIRGPVGFIVFMVYRFGNFVFYKVRIPVIRQILMFLYRILDIIFMRIIGNIEIPPQVKIGKNLGLPHGGNGVMISPFVKIGDNVTIFHQVTIGTKDWEAPTIGNNVSIGAGAKLLGGIKIGNGAIIGTNAVVLKDVPENSIAVGVPARIIHPKN